MVGNIYFISMPYSDFTKVKARPVLVVQAIDKNDVLVLPLTSNLERDGLLITSDDVQDGSLKKDSVIVVPKLTAIDASLIIGSRFLASLKESSFARVKKELCLKIGCV